MTGRPNIDPPAVETRLMDLSRQLEEATDQLDKLDENATNAEYAHEMAYAHASLKAVGTNEMKRKAEAVLATSDELWAMKIAQQRMRSAKNKIKKLDRQIDIGQSLYSGLKTGWGAPRVGAA